MGYWEEMRLRLMELEEELEASGIEDATEWEKFPEMERIMYAIAEHDMRLTCAITAEVAERDEIVELVETANDTAMSELAAFGFISPGYERKLSEYDPEEVVCLYEYGVEWVGHISVGDGIVFDEYAPYSLMV